MGRRRHKHKNKHKNKQQQQPECGHANCDGQCKTEETAEIVEIETQAELQELLDIIMEHGAARTERWQRKQKQLQNALLADAGIPIPVEEPAQAETAAATATGDDTAI
jgi:hypothetical protein